MTWTVGSLFSGIGGIDLGLERAGMKVIWQAETDPGSAPLNDAVRWPTPTAWLGRRESHSFGQAERFLNPARSDELSDALAAAGTSGQLNPAWVEWLMGFPPGWTDLSASEMPSSPRSPSGSGGGS